jgi:sulfatase modifying factor 1
MSCGWKGMFAALLLAIPADAPATDAQRSGQSFRDCPDCPEMVALPGGPFTMGDASPGADQDEQPVHEVTIARFAVGRTEVTHAQFAAFARETDYGVPGPCTTDVDRNGRWETAEGKNWTDTGFPVEDDFPVTCVNWLDAKNYAAWLSRKTGKHYRLLSEAEYEYALRGGTTTQFWWGDDVNEMCRYANGADASVMKLFANWRDGAPCDDGHPFLAPVASYRPNGFGLYDMAGNAWEWTADCYESGYLVQPRDGSAYDREQCRRATRGGSWGYGVHDLRSAQRNWKIWTYQRGADVGFRVARDL